ncbi:MAG TPA: response regulator [Longimicrobiaceae bacterium]|nr:response regulator [Longimicrobiaceae bacterium]
MSEILFAEDDDALRRMTVEVLASAGHAVRAVSNGTDALAELRREAPDLVLLDYRMGSPDGFQVCREIKADPRTAHLPVLILTAQGGVEDRLGGFGAGADDYLAKPFDPRELLARVSALLRLAARGRDRNPTTGLPGGEAIYAELERRRAAGEPFAVVYFDLDHFKPFSDRFGFATADAAIREAGSAVVDAARDHDAFVGHVGGDDFVLCCGTDAARLLAVEAQRRFAAGLPQHLPPDAVRAGTYRALDRGGEEREFPLTRLSAAVVRIDPARWPSFARLGEAVAELKRAAKGQEGGGLVEAEVAP